MRGRTIVLLVIAALLAGGTALMVRSALKERPPVAQTRPLPTPVPQKKILTAAVAITRGQILKPGDLAWRPWPESALSKDFIVADAQPPKSYAGFVAREPFVAGEPIVKAKILSPGERGFLAAVLQPGMRAVSIAVNPTSGISGFVFPGDRVDVLITMPLPPDAGSGGSGYVHKAAETVLHDIRVLAIDQRLDSKDGQAVVARTITLEVTPKQSEIVALADEMGKLSLSLRGLVTAPPKEPELVKLADAGAGSPPRTTIDAVAGHGDSYTLDSEVSQLLPVSSTGRQNLNDGTVTILRGNGTSGTSVGPKSGN